MDLSTGSGLSSDNSSPPQAPAPTVTEVEVPKEMVEWLIRHGKAVVVCESEKRTRSDVWKYFGRVRIPSQGHYCKDVVACIGCSMVYCYRSKSQGTSTLRHHKCPYVFKVLGKDTAAYGTTSNTSRSNNRNKDRAQSKFWHFSNHSLHTTYMHGYGDWTKAEWSMEKE